jgi:hypothetical protein
MKGELNRCTYHITFAWRPVVFMEEGTMVVEIKQRSYPLSSATGLACLRCRKVPPQWSKPLKLLILGVFAPPSPAIKISHRHLIDTATSATGYGGMALDQQEIDSDSLHTRHLASIGYQQPEPFVRRGMGSYRE